MCFWDWMRAYLHIWTHSDHNYSLSLCSLCQLSGKLSFHGHLSCVSICWLYFCAEYCVCLLACVAKSQCSSCASPSKGDLQPLSCGSHEGGTSAKDAVRFSTFKLDIRFKLRSKASPISSGASSLHIARPCCVVCCAAGVLTPPKAAESHKRVSFYRLWIVLRAK